MSTPKYTEPLLDTPQSISVVPQSVLEQQNATTLRDALRNVAGISLAAGEGGAQGDNLTIRGFSVSADIKHPQNCRFCRWDRRWARARDTRKRRPPTWLNVGASGNCAMTNSRAG
jgi:hypothetical protein